MKYLITGFSGFVAKHYLDFLESKNENISVLGLDVTEPKKSYYEYSNLEINFKKVDLLNESEVNDVIVDYKPDLIVHLAGISSVAYSWKHPALCFKNNTFIFLNVLEAIRNNNLKCRILSVGSSEIYGNVNEKLLPLVEDMSIAPINPYAIARLSQESLAKIYVASYSQDIIITRSFNHIGPGQNENFVIPSIIKKLIDIMQSGLNNVVLNTGDLTIIRDFLDVRDVVKAYDLLLNNGQKGEIYNICSGKGVTLNHVVDIIERQLKIKVKREVDPSLLRPDDNRAIVGSFDKIKKHVGWQPFIDIETTINDVITSYA